MNTSKIKADIVHLKALAFLDDERKNLEEKCVQLENMMIKNIKHKWEGKEEEMDYRDKALLELFENQVNSGVFDNNRHTFMYLKAHMGKGPIKS